MSEGHITDKMENQCKELPTPTQTDTENFKFGSDRKKIVKYGSFDSATTTSKRLCLSNSNYSWKSYPSSGITFNAGAYLSPNGSSNTLTGTMYTASEGVCTSVSGMTSFSDSVFDCTFLTPIGGSRTSFERDMATSKSYHSNFGSRDDLDLEKENAFNEEKLKDITMQRENSKDSFKNKIFKGINNKSKKKGRLKRSKESVFEVFVEGNTREKVHKHVKSSVPGILKKSSSCDSESVPLRRRDNHVEPKSGVGGNKAVLVQKVRTIKC